MDGFDCGKDVRFGFGGGFGLRSFPGGSGGIDFGFRFLLGGIGGDDFNAFELDAIKGFGSWLNLGGKFGLRPFLGLAEDSRFSSMVVN